MQEKFEQEAIRMVRGKIHSGLLKNPAFLSPTHINMNRVARCAWHTKHEKYIFYNTVLILFFPLPSYPQKWCSTFRLRWTTLKEQ